MKRRQKFRKTVDVDVSTIVKSASIAGFLVGAVLLAYSVYRKQVELEKMFEEIRNE